MSDDARKNASRRVNFAVMVSFLGRTMGILSSLFLLPVLFRFLSDEEIGLWFLLLSSQTFLGLLGFGVAPTMARHIAFAKGLSGPDPEVELTGESRERIANLVTTGRYILFGVAALVLLVALPIGYFAIKGLDLVEVPYSTANMAWLIVCIGYSIGVYIQYLSSYLIGIGYVGWDTTIRILVEFVALGAKFLIVIFGGGIVGLAIAQVATAVVNRALVVAFIRKRRPDLFHLKGRWQRSLVQETWRPAISYWVMMLGAFMLSKTDAYFIAFFKGVNELPLYQAAYRLFENVMDIAILFTTTSATFISQAWKAEDMRGVHALSFRSWRIGVVVMATGAAFLLTGGNDFLHLWLKTEDQLPMLVLVMIACLFGMRVNFKLLSMAARATDFERWAVTSVIAGILNLGLTWWLIQELGLWGVPLSTLIAVTVTNGWYVTYHSLKRLKVSFGRYLLNMPLFGAGIFLVCFLSIEGLFDAASHLTFYQEQTDWARVAISSGVCAIVGGSAFIAVSFSRVTGQLRRVSRRMHGMVRKQPSPSV
ncbi:MAG: lipopolysaccharide biosynthesis protein [Sumerlaeia bacterium]